MEKLIKDCIGSCPQCDSDNIQYSDHPVNGDNGSIEYTAVCEDCGASFKEVYEVNYLHSETEGEALKSFRVTESRRVVVWRNDNFTVRAKSVGEAKKIALESEPDDFDYTFESEQELTPEQNFALSNGHFPNPLNPAEIMEVKKQWQTREVFVEER